MIDNEAKQGVWSSQRGQFIDGKLRMVLENLFQYFQFWHIIFSAQVFQVFKVTSRYDGTCLWNRPEILWVRLRFVNENETKI